MRRDNSRAPSPQWAHFCLVAFNSAFGNIRFVTPVEKSLKA